MREKRVSGVLTVEDDDVRVTVRWHGDGERVVLSVFRSAARGWVGTGELCGTPGQVPDWLGDGKWEDVRRFVPVVSAWLGIVAG